MCPHRYQRLCVIATLCLLSLIPSAASAVIFEPEEWSDISLFDDDPVYQIGAFYGRASGFYFGKEHDCSAWLISDEILLTADHCLDPEPLNDKATVIFGGFGALGDPNRQAGRDWTRARLLQLGYDVTALSDAQIDTLRTFKCQLQETLNTSADDHHDVAVLRCEPLSITHQIAGTSVTFSQLLPGQIFGHVKLKIGALAKDAKVYAVSANSLTGDNLRRLLLSPHGWVHDAAQKCSLLAKDCLEFVGADALCGSSGGVLFDESSHRAVAMVTNVKVLGDLLDPEADCDRTVRKTTSASLLLFSNIGTYLTEKVANYATPPAPTLAPFSSNGTTSTSARIGDQAGTVTLSGSCNTDRFAVGIVGTVASAKTLGRVGIVCLPLTTLADYRIDRAGVVVFGVSDADSVKNMDFTRYVNENLSTSNHLFGTGWQPTFALCPAGYLLSGVRAKGESTLQQITHILCRAWNDPQQTVERPLLVPLGSSTGTATDANCPNGSVAKGISVFRASTALGLQFSCVDLQGPGDPVYPPVDTLTPEQDPDTVTPSTSDPDTDNGDQSPSPDNTDTAADTTVSSTPSAKNSSSCSVSLSGKPAQWPSLLWLALAVLSLAYQRRRRSPR